MKIRLIIVFAFILGACSPTPVPDHYWCHAYDFLAGAASVGNGNGVPAGLNHINYQAAGWVPGFGLKTINNELIVNWQENFYFRPETVSIKIWRGYNEPTDVPINVAINANFFSIVVNGQTDVLAADDSDIVLSLNNTNPPNTDFNAASVTLQSSHEIVIEWIKVYGDGVNPFGTNNCDLGTATPPPPTATPTIEPSNTPVPMTNTNTPTHTRTPTPTGTASTCFRMDYYFTTSVYNESTGQYSWTPGLGLSTQSFHPNNFEWSNRLVVRWAASYNLGISVSRIEVDVVYYVGGSQGESEFKIRYRPAIATNPTYELLSVPGRDGTIIWNNTGSPLALKAIELYSYPGSDTTNPADENPGGEIVVSSMRVYGTGSPDPTAWPATITSVPCWDITPTPTLTPSLTPTPSPTVLTNTPAPTATRTPLPVTPIVTATSSRTTIVVSSPVPTFTRTPTTAPSLTFPPPPSPTPGPSNTPGPTSTASPTWTTATGFPVVTWLPPNYTPTYGGTPIIFPTGEGTGTPIATFEPLPTRGEIGGKSDIYNGLGTAVAHINGLPGEISGGLPAIDANFTVFSGYARWMISGVSLQEIFGQRIYPIVLHFISWIAIIVFWNGVQMVIRIVSLILKVFIWLFNLLLKLK